MWVIICFSMLGVRPRASRYSRQELCHLTTFQVWVIIKLLSWRNFLIFFFLKHEAVRMLYGRTYGRERIHPSLCELLVIGRQTQGSGQGCSWEKTRYTFVFVYHLGSTFSSNYVDYCDYCVNCLHKYLWNMVLTLGLCVMYRKYISVH